MDNIKYIDNVICRNIHQWLKEVYYKLYHKILNNIYRY